MKRISVILSGLLLTIVIMLFGGCSHNNETLIGKPFKPDSDTAFVIDGKTRRIKGDADELINAVPGEYSYSEALSCMTEGYDKTYDFGFIKIETVPSGGEDRLSCITVTGEGISTPRGISVGSSKEDVISAYGENGYKEGPYLVFSESGDPNDISGAKLYFKIENDTVTEMIAFDPGF